MSDVTVEVEAPEESEESESPTVVVVDSDNGDDVVTASLVERVTRLEDTLAITVATVEELGQAVAGLAVIDEVQQQEIEVMANEVAQEEEEEEVEEEEEEEEEVATPEAKEENSEPPSDEVPTIREHFFFRKWGKQK